ncbi:MAG: hypothetical protein GX825_00275 [Syntrophomonadaceae bacterium]|nr:hypothetical protein [Syntrophomonadaceae bacterium]
MTTKDIIRCYAGLQPEQRFSRKNLLSWMRDVGLFRDGSEAAINLSLSLMLKSGELIKESWGTYILPLQKKRLFIPIPSNEIRDINHLLKVEFSYTRICVWDPQIIVPFMQHIPNLNLLIVEIERIAMEPAFNLLQEKVSDRRVIFNPSSEDYARYVSGFPSIIVKPLISQAPLINFGGINMPSLEKVMVDISGDVEFSFAQGAELYTIYENLLSSFVVNYKALYRYADRRARRSQVESIVKTCEP